MSTSELRADLDAKARIESELAKVEKQIYDLESNYFEETAGFNIVRGYAGFTKCVHYRTRVLYFTPPPRGCKTISHLPARLVQWLYGTPFIDINSRAFCHVPQAPCGTTLINYTAIASFTCFVHRSVVVKKGSVPTTTADRIFSLSSVTSPVGPGAATSSNASKAAATSQQHQVQK